MSKKYTTNFLEDTNGSTGSANQVLISTPSGIDWVDGSGSSIIGGPYLPLSAGASYPLTGNLYLDDGTGASPSLYFKNGADNYWQYLMQSDGDFVIKEGTSTRLTFQAGGNVGIGETNPGEKLSVAPDTDISAEIGRAHIGYVGWGDYAGFSHVDLNTQTTYSLLQSPAGTTFLNAASGENIRFRINNDDKAILDSNGNVGIGTTSPDGLLNLKHTSSSSSVANDATAYALTLNFEGATGDYGRHIAIRDTSGQAVAAIGGYDEGTGGATGLFFATGNATTAAQEAMMIDSSGNVGIGTTSPSSVLHIKNSTPEILLEDSDTANRKGKILANNGNLGLFADPDNVQSSSIIYFNIDSSEKMRITSAGNVGIGTTSVAMGLHVADTKGALFGPTTGPSMYISPNDENTINGGYGLDTDTGDLWLNYRGYLNGFTRFRDTRIGDGKGNAIVMVDGSSGNVGIGTTSPGSELEVDGEITTTTITYDEPSAVDSSAYNGEVVYFGTFLSIAAGDLIVLTVDSGGLAWKQARDTASSLATGMLGIALGTSASAGVLVRGFAKNSSWGLGWTVSDKLYLSPDAGDISNSITQDTNDYVRIIGYYLGSNKIYFCPDNTYIQNS